MAYEALDSLQQTLTKILKRDDDLTTHRVKQDIISIHDKAAVLQLNLKAFPEKETIRKVASTTHDIIEYLFSPENLSGCRWTEPSVRVSKQLRELAEKLDLIVGDVVDYCKVNDVRQHSDYPALSGLSLQLERLAEKILSSPRDLADYSRSKVAFGIDEDLSYSADDAVSSSSRPAPTIKDGVVVGFEEDLEQIMDWLISGPSNLEVLPIVGMAGIGKTALAQIVYDHPLIRSHFDICVWVTVSQNQQNHSVKYTFSNLLDSMIGKGFEGESDKHFVIYKILYDRRYLIVLDDIWRTKVWKDLFPDNNNGSRILLTTRLRDVADYFHSIHEMRFLDEQQSWELFQRKVFADQTCPLELQTVAKKIVTSCGGLPLSIVTVAEQLSNIDRTPRLWEQIVATDGDGRLESIFSSSYNHLPQHLKACFLYMAGFPEDYEIRVTELIKLWIAEGFLEGQYESKTLEGQYESKTLEEMAEGYLEDLVDRSLVLVVTSRKSDSKIKSCRLHNNVRDFCIRQAGLKKFLLPVMDYLPTPILRRHFLPQLLKNHRRISATWYDLDLKDSMHSSCTQSIICIPQRGYRPKGSVRNCSSLRVLHVLRRDDHSYWELGQVFDLIHLTYLASNIPCSIVPPAISKLQNLQTLIIYRSGVRLPMEIWSLRKLRHLIAFSFDPLPHPEAAALPLENLQTLSIVTNFVCSGRMLKKIPNIQKLGICYSGEKFDERYHLDNIRYLHRLEKLKLEMLNGAFRPRINPIIPRPRGGEEVVKRIPNVKKLEVNVVELDDGCSDFDLSNLDQLHKLEPFICKCDVLVNINFPHSLKKLSLDMAYNLQWEDMLENIGSLPLLQKLILKRGWFRTQTWETVEGQFPNLKVLKLRQCGNLSCWTSRSSHFPQLERLVLDGLHLLNEIPPEIGEIETLQSILLKFCSRYLVISAKRLQEEQEELYREGPLRVRVKLNPKAYEAMRGLAAPNFELRA